MRNRKGFTLLEVLTAIAVVAIISGPLLYTFVTSTKVGRHSYDSDKANALSVELVETVKAAAGDFGGYAYSYTYSEGKYWHNYEKTSYYGADWTPNVPQSEAIYRAALTVKGEDTGSGVYMSYVPELVDTAGNSYRIEVDYTLLSTGDCGITMDSLPGDLYRVSASAGILVDTRDGLHKPAVEFPAGDLKTGIVPVIIDLGETPGARCTFSSITGPVRNSACMCTVITRRRITSRWNHLPRGQRELYAGQRRHTGL